MPNLKDLARDLREFANQDLRRATERTNRRIAEFALEEARKRSSGAISSKALRDAPPGLNHPYGISPFNSRGDRGAIPYGDESIINRQTGLFYRSWRVAGASSIAGVPLLMLQNDAPYAKWLEHGTHWMIARPIDVQIKRRIEEVAPKIAMEEFGRVIGARFSK